MTTITVLRPTQVKTPRATAAAAALFTRVLGWMDRLTQQRQARDEQRDSDRRRAEAAALRRYARLHLAYDAGFTADLLAAADRHVRDDE
jgi:hypothetical protein